MAQPLTVVLGYWMDSPDMQILASALYYDTLHPDDVTFVTNDLNLYVTANFVFGKDSVQMIGYEEEEDYVGYQKQVMSDEELSRFYTNLNSNLYNLEIGQYLLIFNSENKLVDTVVWTGEEHRHLKFGCFSSRTFGNIKPIGGDAYQACAVDSLLNNQVTMIKGAPGSGKTTLALGYLFSLLERGKISKIVIFCNTVATKNSARLGFYPGTREDKLMDSQIGNLLISKLGSRMAVEELIETDQLVLLPMSDIRGYETPDESGVYISEAQNLDIELMKLALTRISDNSVCIIDGDDKTQVDCAAYGGANNGMRRVIKVFKGAPFFGVVELQQVHRGKVADLARKL